MLKLYHYLIMVTLTHVYGLVALASVVIFSKPRCVAEITCMYGDIIIMYCDPAAIIVKSCDIEIDESKFIKILYHYRPARNT